MILESQVCNKELAEKLRDLEVKQESQFYWWQHAPSKYGETQPLILIAPDYDRRRVESYREAFPKALMVSAFTASELGELLPTSCDFYKPEAKTVASSKGTWKCTYNGEEVHREYSDTLADAMAKMLLYLIQQRIINV